MSEPTDADRIANLERQVQELTGAVHALSDALALRAGSRRLFDERPVTSGLSVWHGEWEATCAMHVLEHLVARRPAAAAHPKSDGYSSVVLALAEGLQLNPPAVD
ncbi:MAG: hypothetical protein ACT6R7_02610 [Brevundimonas aurantiaca]|jgi:hypothetical protein|uniref:hypothetical protein n=1 Tax=Brevundimonas aurantiaca TaxID=74316 RepID=UPI004034C1D3